MTDIKNLRKIVRDAKETLRLAKRPTRHAKIEQDRRLEKRIMKLRGNIASVKVEVKRLKA